MRIILLLFFLTSTTDIFTQSEAELRKLLAQNPNNIQAYTKLIGLATTREQIIKIGNEAIAQLGPRSIIHTSIGDAFMDAKDYNNAVNSYRTALSLNPRSATSYNRLGLALLKIGYVHQAEVAFKAAITFAPVNSFSSLQYQTHLAIAFETQKNIAQAKETIQKILTVNPSFKSALEVQQRLASQ